MIAGGDARASRLPSVSPRRFQSLVILQPEWTDFSRVYETRWASSLRLDPSTLGHGAAKINQSAPSSLKKVDYYPAVELMYLTLDVRLLD